MTGKQVLAAGSDCVGSTNVNILYISQ